MAFSEQLLMDRVNVVDAGEVRREKRAQQCGSWHGHAAYVRYGLACGVTVRDRSHTARVPVAGCVDHIAKLAEPPAFAEMSNSQMDLMDGVVAALRAIDAALMCCTKCSHWRRLIRNGRLAWQGSKRQRRREAFPN